MISVAGTDSAVVARLQKLAKTEGILPEVMAMGSTPIYAVWAGQSAPPTTVHAWCRKCSGRDIDKAVEIARAQVQDLGLDVVMLTHIPKGLLSRSMSLAVSADGVVRSFQVGQDADFYLLHRSENLFK